MGVRPTTGKVAGSRPAGARVAPATATALVIWAGLLVVANRWGQAILDQGVPIRIHAPPLIGRFQFGPDQGFTAVSLLAPVTAVALVASAGRATQRLPWRRLLVTAGAAAGLWAVALALVSGWYWLQRPMELPGHYLLDVGNVGSPGDFLARFTDEIESFGTHVRSHPPGFLLLLWALDRAGLSGGGWAAALVIAGGAAAVPAVLLALREVAGEGAARGAAPFLVLAPTALYVATTADAFFAGVGAWAVALTVTALFRSGRRSDAIAAAGGVLFGVTLMLSYGLVLLGAIPLVAAVPRRRWRPLAVAAGAGLAVLAGVALTGFNWIEGLAATRVEYYKSVASVRPAGYFFVANLAAFGVIVGPATAAGLARLRDGGVWLLVGGALVAVALANLSGMSKGEVERIWLPFAFWTVPAASALAPGPGRALVGWLTATAAVGLAVQIGVRTHW